MSTGQCTHICARNAALLSPRALLKSLMALSATSRRQGLNSRGMKAPTSLLFDKSKSLTMLSLIPNAGKALVLGSSSSSKPRPAHRKRPPCCVGSAKCAGQASATIPRRVCFPASLLLCGDLLGCGGLCVPRGGLTCSCVKLSRVAALASCWQPSTPTALSSCTCTWLSDLAVASSCVWLSDLAVPSSCALLSGSVAQSSRVSDSNMHLSGCAESLQ
mmetsp:Transcript_112985/g.224958  ORF Transcript_112985/g.224958 Transcript_112985/m.224958 type:complete len:217 (+) Transcript_112985:709-1359(+)